MRNHGELFRTLIETLSHGVAEIEAAGTVAYANEAFCRMLEYSREELIGRSMLDFLSSDDERTCARQPLAFFAKQQPPPNPVFCWTRTKDGKILDVQIDWAYKKDEKGTVTGVLFLITDITRLKKLEKDLQESEERFRVLFESARDCIFMKDPSKRYTLVNPAMERLLDLPASEIVGRTDQEVHGLETPSSLAEVDSRVLNGQAIETEHAIRVKGRPVALLDFRTPIRDARGETVAICGIAQNITDRKLEELEHPCGDSPYPSPAMATTMMAIHRAAQTNSTILLTGESGAGKDHLARYIHDQSPRANGPFHAINCGALPPEIAESELFGHERGAYTGAARRKRGLLELAEGGTLLLNEIGDLPLPVQAKLLTFFDTWSFTRVGGEKSTTVDVRVISATNRDLWSEVLAGRFRNDLFHRLNVLSIRVPPLRERIEDLPVLVQEIVPQVARELNITELPPIESSAIARLALYNWPGNVRELRNVLERELILEGGKRLEFHSLEMKTSGEKEWSVQIGFPKHGCLDAVARDLVRRLIEEALRRSGGKKTKAAELLGVSRHALRRRMMEVGLAGRKSINDPA